MNGHSDVVGAEEDGTISIPETHKDVFLIASLLFIYHI